MRKFAYVFVGILIKAVTCGAVASGAVIVQQEPPPGSSVPGHYLAFEAEQYDAVSDVTKWGVVTDPAASGGLAVRALSTLSPKGTLSYEVSFAVPGDYYVYARMKAVLNQPGSHDRIKFSWDGAESVSLKGYLNDTNKYHWYPSAYEASPFFVTILPADVGRVIPVTITITVDGVNFDRLIFHTTSPIDEYKLDALINSPIVESVPEPAGAIMIGGMLLAMGIRRRRPR